MKKLSSKRIQLLQLIGKGQHSGRFPLVRELAQELGLVGESSLTRMLDALEQDRYIVKQGGGQERHRRIYTLTRKAQSILPDLSALLRVPLLGDIPAGPLAEAIAEAIEECAEWIDLGDGLRVQAGDFFLTVKGDSMIGDGILPGDRVLLRPGIQVNNGEIAGVQIRRDTGAFDSTLKHVHCRPNDDTVGLRASNPAYEEIVVAAEDVEVVGVYRGLLRSLM